MENWETLKSMVNSPELERDIQKLDYGNARAGTRVRKAMADIRRKCQFMRDEVQTIRAKAREQKK